MRSGPYYSTKQEEHYNDWYVVENQYWPYYLDIDPNKKNTTMKI